MVIKIEKPWCIRFGTMGDVRIGKIVGEHAEVVDVQYSEGQQYSPETWDYTFVKRYKRFTNMVVRFAKLRGGSFKRSMEKALDDFPSQKKQ